MKRLVLVGLIAALGGTLALDAIRPAGERAPSLAAPYAGGGVLVCPLGVEGDARAFLHLANLEDARATVRISVVPGRGRPEVLERTLMGGQARSIRLHGRVDGRASVVVEHTGGRVAASHSLWFRRRAPSGIRRVILPHGGAAAACAAPGPGSVALSNLATEGREVRLLVYNPGAADASVSISLQDGSRALHPERLRNRIIRPRRFRMFRLEDFAFNAAELTAVVQATSGRVVAEALKLGPQGVSLVEGDPPRTALVAVSGDSGRPARIGFGPIGESDTGVEGTLIGSGSQGRAGRLPPDLAPGRTVSRITPPLDEGGPAAYQLDVTIGDPVAAGTSWNVQRRGTDRAAVGSSTTATRWVAAAGWQVPQGQVRAVIVNPGAASATMRLRRPSGEGAEDLTVEPGRLVRVPVGRGEGAFALEVSSDRPVTVLLEGLGSEVRGNRTTTYGFGFYATPVPEHDPVPIALDPRSGVPAPLRRGQ